MIHTFPSKEQHDHSQIIPRNQTELSLMAPLRTVLVVGSAGYIGSAVCQAFVRAGWRVFGLIRKSEQAASLIIREVIPVEGSLSNSAFLVELLDQASSIDVVVGCAEPKDYAIYLCEMLDMIHCVAQANQGVRPLLLWTSGSKDYGPTKFENSILSPFTETSVLNPPPPLLPRTTSSIKLLDNNKGFDVAVLRPTAVYGYGSSYYGGLFKFAENAQKNGSQYLQIAADPQNILHAIHVDDCADAYVALAEHSDRRAVSGQCFNISAQTYETNKDILKALAKEYRFLQGARFVDESQPSNGLDESIKILFGFSQWVSSEKLRELTGWRDRRMVFTENLHIYRLAYQAAANIQNDDLIVKINNRQSHWNASEWLEPVSPVKV
ncbi:hypothetical protein V8C42DRAFT_319745 [Trichoderma barbatum]